MDGQLKQELTVKYQLPFFYFPKIRKFMASTNSCQIFETKKSNIAPQDNRRIENSSGKTKKKDGRNGSTRVSCNPLPGASLRLWITGGKNKDVSQMIDPPQADAAASTNSDANLTADQLNQSESRGDFEGLPDEEKSCLLSCAVFPENAVVKKRLLVNWWIAEGFLDPSNNGEKTVLELEDIATKILKNLMAKKFILPVNKKRKKVSNRFKMDPVLRSQVITLAQQQKFFNYNSEGNLTLEYSDSERACLINGEKPELKNQEKIKTLVNVSQRILDFTFDSFSKMKNVQVLCLGMWQSSLKSHHIEVENTEFLKGLKNMASLKLLSLEGISGIEELPSSISKVRKLRFLNLRACYNLESLPKEIKSLKMLTHLDLSECYLLDHMPKELLHLSDLQVLKGFVITDASHEEIRNKACTLADLPGLKKLRKLSINVNSETFSVEELATLLFKFKELEKLSIAWGGGSKAVDVAMKKDYNRQASVAAAPKKLEKQKTFLEKVVGKSKSKVDRAMETKLKKLDLQCCPQKTLPTWLIPENLTNLKKLYIRGGRITGLGKFEEGALTWEVEVLHLKYLSELKVNWSELKAIFPKLNYLKKFRCPKVTFCPCDGSGVWLESSIN